MRIELAVLASSTLLTVSSAALARPLSDDQAKALIVKADCATCHAVGSQVVGPAYQEVAKKYKGDPKAAEALFKKVRAGGSGSFGLVGPHGEVKMPANPREKISDKHLKRLIAWILAQ